MSDRATGGSAPDSKRTSYAPRPVDNVSVAAEICFPLVYNKHFRLAVLVLHEVYAAHLSFRFSFEIFSNRLLN